MKVKELIALLSQFDGDLEVIDNYDRFFNQIVEVKLFKGEVVIITAPKETNRLKSIELVQGED